jgi:hypothetical protein
MSAQCRLFSDEDQPTDLRQDPPRLRTSGLDGPAAINRLDIAAGMAIRANLRAFPAALRRISAGSGPGLARGELEWTVGRMQQRLLPTINAADGATTRIATATDQLQR